MRDIEKMQTKETRFEEDNKSYRMIVKYGFHYIEGNSEPYFAITGEIWRRNRLDSCGAFYEEIAEHLPELFPLCDFHLWGQNTKLPMYYLENGWYHYNNRNENDHFKNHILWKETEGELPVFYSRNDFDNWMNERAVMLKILFEETLVKFNVEKIEL